MAGGRTKLQEQKEPRRDEGAQARRSLTLTPQVALMLVLIHRLLPGFIPPFTTDGCSQSEHELDMCRLEIAFLPL
jgi:hypothetical protein